MSDSRPFAAAPPRTFLYVPADRPDRLAKAFRSGTDTVLVDLEDGVAATSRSAAAGALPDALAGAAVPGVGIALRVPSGDDALGWVARIAGALTLDAVVLAKTEESAELDALARTLDGVGSDADIVPLLESPAAVLAIDSFARAPRVRRVLLGEADLRAALSLPRGGSAGLDHVRATVVLRGAALGLEPPIGSTSLALDDLGELHASSAHLRDLGFFGRTCIHPAQVATVNRAFSPDADEVAWARDVVGRESGATRAGDGSFVDPAIQRSAHRILSLARRDSAADID